MIDILLATYNGEKYIQQQIDSILAQTNKDWRLVVCDDCSCDGTWELLKGYAERYPEQIEVHQNERNSGSANANFMSMLSLVKGEYIMFSDQDDIWLPNKIEMTYRAMRILEERYSECKPILVHSDLTVVAEDRSVIHQSMFAIQKLQGGGRTLKRQLVQNTVTGCTVMFNHALWRMLLIKPENYIMHDWWIALVAACFGKIGFVNVPTILYRQHDHNVEGAKDYTGLRNTIKIAAKGEKLTEAMEKTYIQAAEFLRIYEAQMEPEQVDLIATYASMAYVDHIARAKTMIRHGFWKSSWNRRVGQLFFN